MKTLNVSVFRINDPYQPILRVVLGSSFVQNRSWELLLTYAVSFYESDYNDLFTPLNILNADWAHVNL